MHYISDLNTARLIDILNTVNILQVAAVMLVIGLIALLSTSTTGILGHAEVCPQIVLSSGGLGNPSNTWFFAPLI